MGWVQMSAEDVQVLRDGYAAFARQDVPAVMAAFDPGIEWHAPESLPFGGSYHGHEGVGAFFGQLPSHWTDLSVEPQEFIDGGDTIAVIVRCAAPARAVRSIPRRCTSGGCAMARPYRTPSSRTRHGRGRRSVWRSRQTSADGCEIHSASV